MSEKLGRIDHIKGNPKTPDYARAVLFDSNGKPTPISLRALRKNDKFRLPFAKKPMEVWTYNWSDEYFIAIQTKGEYRTFRGALKAGLRAYEVSRHP